MADKRQSKLSVGTLQNLLNNKPIEDDGVYKFVSLNGKLSYQFEYKEDKISSVGTTVTKTQLLKLKKYHKERV